MTYRRDYALRGQCFDDTHWQYHSLKIKTLGSLGWCGLSVTNVSSQDQRHLTQWLSANATGRYYRTMRIYADDGLEVWFENSSDRISCASEIEHMADYEFYLVHGVTPEGIEDMRPWLRKIRYGIFYDISRTTYTVRMEQSPHAIAARLAV